MFLKIGRGSTGIRPLNMDCAQVMELGFLFESDFLIACKYNAREMATGLDECVYTAAEEA